VLSTLYWIWQFLTRNKTISDTRFGSINRLCQEIKNMKSNIPREEQNKAKREGRIQRRIYRKKNENENPVLSIFWWFCKVLDAEPNQSVDSKCKTAAEQRRLGLKASDRRTNKQSVRKICKFGTQCFLPNLLLYLCYILFNHIALYFPRRGLRFGLGTMTEVISLTTNHSYRRRFKTIKLNQAPLFQQS
jgi:hypothetical protein